MRVALPAAFLTTPLAHRAYHNRAQGRPDATIRLAALVEALMQTRPRAESTVR